MITFPKQFVALNSTACHDNNHDVFYKMKQSMKFINKPFFLTLNDLFYDCVILFVWREYKTSNMKLVYWAIPARAHVIRAILHYHEIEFEDEILDFETGPGKWKKLKPNLQDRALSETILLTEHIFVPIHKYLFSQRIKKVHI